MASLERALKSVDLLEEATGGLFRWDDEGMDDFEKGWEIFSKGNRVEVLTKNGWLMGTVRECMRENERVIVIECDVKYSNNEEYYGGRGATVMVYHNTRRGIWSVLRLVDRDPEFITPSELRERLQNERLNTIYLLAKGLLVLKK